MRLIAPGRDWGWLRRGRDNLAVRCVPVRNKAARIKPIDELIKLGKALMRKAERASKLLPLSRAVLFRDGLTITLLAYCPVRLSNLAMITLERHLFRRTAGYDLYFSHDEVKWGQPIERSVPADLAAALSRYLDHYRPVLLTRGGLQKARESDALGFQEKHSAAPQNDPRPHQGAYAHRVRQAFMAASLPRLHHDLRSHRGPTTCPYRQEPPRS